MTIPARAHFCWIGGHLPWAYVFAVLSAAARSELVEIVLHHTDTLEEGAGLTALERAPRVRLARLAPLALLDRAGRALADGGALATLYRDLDSPVKQTDVLRAAILYLEGGIYLDMDTVTTASLLPLLDRPQFLGSEFIVWPLRVRRSHSPLVWARALALDLLRKTLRQLPGGWKAFRLVERFYFRGVNNAVMGSEPAGRLFADYLRAMTALPPQRRADAYALGPDLLQALVEGRDDVAILAPEIFYPLAPEISEHWFRIGRGAPLARVLSARTLVVHWYASVRTRSRVAEIGPGYVRRHRGHQLYSALICAALPTLPEEV